MTDPGRPPTGSAACPDDPAHEHRSPIETLDSDLVRDQDLADITADVIACRACPRLVAWREQAAREPPLRYRDQAYWARPVPGFGDPAARIVVVGLAPAANGGNRTGRVFTGDRSGDVLFASLHRVGLANQPTSVSAHDGLELRRTYVVASVRCAPPANRPTPDERDRCLPYLVRELRVLRDARVIVTLGAFGWDAALRALGWLGHRVRPRPGFGHALERPIGPYLLLGCYHPSQRNTFTGLLTPDQLDDVFRRAIGLADERRSADPDPAPPARRPSGAGPRVRPGGGATRTCRPASGSPPTGGSSR